MDDRKISRIEINSETGDPTFFFEGSNEPWSHLEFLPHSRTRLWLEEIADAIDNFHVNAGVVFNNG